MYADRHAKLTAEAADLRTALRRARARVTELEHRIEYMLDDTDALRDRVRVLTAERAAERGGRLAAERQRDTLTRQLDHARTETSDLHERLANGIDDMRHATGLSAYALSTRYGPMYLDYLTPEDD